jgi:hypothetical protein
MQRKSSLRMSRRVDLEAAAYRRRLATSKRERTSRRRSNGMGSGRGSVAVLLYVQTRGRFFDDIAAGSKLRASGLRV